MENSDRRFILEQLALGGGRFRSAFGGLTPEEWTFQATDGRWTVADNVEHVTLVESRVLAGIQRRLAGAGDAARLAETIGKDALVLGMNRANRFDAPEAVAPKRTMGGAAELVAAFERARAATEEFVEKGEGDLRSRSFAHAKFGELDLYQWLLLLGVHCGRHAEQIEELRGLAEFPSA